MTSITQHSRVWTRKHTHTCLKQTACTIYVKVLHVCKHKLGFNISRNSLLAQRHCSILVDVIFTPNNRITVCF